MPILLIFVAIAVIISSFGTAFGDIASGGSVTYREERMQDYADEQYAQVFAGSRAYEDNILLVMLVDEEYYEYQFIAWVGDHVDDNINLLFGNNSSELGRVLNSNIGTNYKYSLDKNMAIAVGQMEQRIEAMALDSSFNCEETRTEAESRMYNYTQLSLTASTVDTALASFTDSTGIPIAIVVEYSENVFGRQIAAQSIITMLIAVALIVVAVVMIVKRYKRSKRNQNNGGDNNNYNNSYNNNYSNNHYQR